MGVIKRQGIKYSIVGYIATAIGAISTLFVYPLDENIYGYALFLVGTATFFYPLMSGGLASLAVRFFPDMKSKDGRNAGFLGFLQLSSVVTFTVFASLFFLFGDSIRSGLLFFNMDADLVLENMPLILALTFLITQINIIIPYTSNFERIVIPNMLTNMLFKVLLPTLVLLFYFKKISMLTFGWGVVGYHLLGLLGLIIYLYSIRGLNWRLNFKKLTKQKVKEMGIYTSYGMLGGIGNVMAFRIDLFMVPTLLGLFSTGVYGIAQFIGNSVELPAKAIFQISAPILSKAMKEKDMDHVAMIYRKASLNLTIVGVILLALIMCNIDALFQLTSKYETLIAGKMVVFWIGLTKLVDMATSVNSSIISYSRYFRFNFYLVLMLAIFNISLNLWLIPVMGIEGAALATFLSICMTNAVKLAYVWYRFGMQPFSPRHVLTLGIGGAVYALGVLLPVENLHPILSIGIRSALMGGGFVLAIYYLQISKDINELIEGVLSKMKK
jgi:O-antigen/teichoic acid export membrane protein